MVHRIIELVQKINEICNNSVTGPSCINPQVCLADCCAESVDIPKKLSDLYIQREFAAEKDFIRTNLCTFRIRINPETYHCHFYNTKNNGCTLHQQQIKPPNCALYPLKFSTQPNLCKRHFEFKISDDKKSQLEQLFAEYKQLCFSEYLMKSSYSAICNRLASTFLEEIMSHPPAHVVGVVDGYWTMHPLVSETDSIDFLPFCDHITCSESYYGCEYVCWDAARWVIQELREQIYAFIQEHGALEEYYIKTLERSGQ